MTTEELRRIAADLARRYGFKVDHAHRGLMWAADEIERLEDEAIAEKAALAKAGVISGDDARRLDEEMARNSGKGRR